MYLAFDNDTGREVAWNVISFSHLNRSERKRIDAEIQIAKSLDHPRILRFVSAWINREKEEVVFITERVSGGSLRQYIARLDGPLKMKVIKNWCKQILEGIAYLHGQSNPVIHRDLKCDNIFINGNDGKVLIGDLGLSTSLRGAASCATSIVGTPEFMAPELYEEKYGPPVDIYAFGMCLLEMVSRRYPYAECTTPGQIYKKVIASERPLVLSRVKDEILRHLIEGCLDTNPDNRPTAVELLADPYWGQLEEGDKLAEIDEEEKEDKDGGEPVVRDVRLPRSGAYHVEAETRRQQAAAAAAATVPPSVSTPSNTSAPSELSGVVEFLLPPLSHPNVVAGPTDDTLILLSSPKSTRRSIEHLAKSDVLTFCRRKGIERVEKVHLILELTEAKFHNVIFDFNALTDHPLIIATELRDAGLVWTGVSEEELVSQIGKAIMDRIAEVQSAMSSGLDLLTGDPEFPEVRRGSITSPGRDVDRSRDAETNRRGSTPASPGSREAILPTVSSSPQIALVEHPLTSSSRGKPPLPPPPSQTPPSRGSMEASGFRKNNSYQAFDTMEAGDSAESLFVLLSREACAHLITPCGPSIGEVLTGPRSSIDMGGFSMGSASPSSSIDGIGPVTHPGRTASIGNSMDELANMMAGQHFTLANWPSSAPPKCGSPPRTPSSEDVKQLQQMLAVVMISERARIASFVPGVYCAFTEDTVRDFQSHNGLEISGAVDDRTWEILSDQVEHRRKKEEERGLKREEAQRKARQEQERKLAMQKEESARAMDNIMEKTLSSIAGGSSAKKSVVQTSTTTSPTAVASSLLVDFPKP